MPRQHQILITESDSLKARRKMLEALAKAARKKGATDESRWVRVSTIGLIYPSATASAMLRLGLIETRYVRVEYPRSDHVLHARITQHGLWALENNLLTYRTLQKSIYVPAATYRAFERLAEKLDVRMPTGRGAGKRPGVVSLLVAMAAKEDALERWVRHVYAKEYQE